MSLPRGLWLLAVFAAAPALAFDVQVGEIAGLRSVRVTGTDFQGMAIIEIANLDRVEAVCEIILDSGPNERTRQVRIPPRSTKTLTQAIEARTQHVRVRGICN